MNENHRTTRSGGEGGGKKDKPDLAVLSFYFLCGEFLLWRPKISFKMMMDICF